MNVEHLKKILVPSKRLGFVYHFQKYYFDKELLFCKKDDDNDFIIADKWNCRTVREFDQKYGTHILEEFKKWIQ